MSASSNGDRPSAVIYIESLSRSVSFRPYLAQLGGRAVVHLLCNWILKQTPASEITILHHYQAEEHELMNAVAGHTTVKVVLARQPAKLQAIVEHLPFLSARQIVTINVGAILAPADLLTRALQHHLEETASATVLTGIPHECSLAIFERNTLEQVAVTTAKFGITDPELGLEKIVAAARLLEKNSTFRVRTASLDVPVSYRARPQSIPQTISLRLRSDFEFADAVLRTAPSDPGSPLAVLQHWKRLLIEDRAHQITQIRRMASSPTVRHRKRVVYISQPSAFSGAEESLCSMISALDPLDFELYVVTSREGVFADRLRQLGVSVICPEKRLADGSIAGYAYFQTVFQQLQPDLIHLNGRESLPAVLAAANTGVPIVQHIRNGDMTGFEDGVVVADAIISVSEFLKQEVLRFPIDENKVRVIYDEVDSAEFRPNYLPKESARQQLGLSMDDKVCLMIARLAPNKRHDVMLRAAGMVSKECSGFKLLLKTDVMTDSPEYGRARTMIKNLRIESCVRWIDFVPDIRTLFAAADVLVLCSDREGLGRCVVEAMSMQVPVVVTDTGGSHEVITDGEVGGFIVAGGDAEAIANRLLRLFENDELRRILGENGRQYVRRVLDCRVTAAAVSNTYNELLQKGSHGALETPADKEGLPEGSHTVCA